VIKDVKIDDTAMEKPGEVISKEDYIEENVDKVILTKKTVSAIMSDNSKTYKVLNVQNIYSDEGDFVFEFPPENKLEYDGTLVKIPRELLKKVIYDLYLQ